MTDIMTAETKNGGYEGFAEDMRRLLISQADRLCEGESSSVSNEVMRELMLSICYVLEIPDINDENALRRFYGADIEAEFKRGLRKVKRKCHMCTLLWQRACRTAIYEESISMTDTLKSIGGVRKRMDTELFAHIAPCDIDYQLSSPVPEELPGIDYINEYLRRLIIENEFIGRFDEKRVKGLLSSFCRGYKSLLINLFEPVAANALGLALIGEDPYELDVPPEKREDIFRRLRGRSGAELMRALMTGVEKLCGAMGICGGGTERYIKDFAASLTPRLAAALESGDISGIFINM